MNAVSRILGSLALAIAPVAAAAQLSAPPPLPPSPIAFFRQLLTTNQQGRELALRNHPEIQRGLIEAKLQEYEALPATEREHRLRATEFRYYLRPLLLTTVTNRPLQVAAIPAEHRELIRERLNRWDALTEATRRDLLAYDHAVAWLARFHVANRVSSGPPRPPVPPPPSGSRLEAELARWQAMPETQRDQLCRQFERFLELPDPQRERALGELSPEERTQMEGTLAAFARLPVSQRQLCIGSFRKFAQLSPAERAGFLKSADRWREMSPADRAHWRQIVANLPPLPPGFSSPPPLPPPLPLRQSFPTKQ
jgi:hypothetical protein